ncbi:Uncharacterized protein GBIM_17686 [Gryllus bimaculatus]|nr:Uncharacterized protein GBIM_17686 [Gryllus bimaculatus]
MYLRGHRSCCASPVGVLELDKDGQWPRLQHAQHEVVQGTRSFHIGEQLKRDAPAARAQRPQAAEEDLVFCSEGRRCALQSPQDGRLGTEAIIQARGDYLDRLILANISAKTPVLERLKNAATPYGSEYEIFLGGLWALRARSRGLSFQLFSNVAAARPLDDLVLRVLKPRPLTIFIQLKHANTTGAATPVTTQVHTLKNTKHLCLAEAMQHDWVSFFSDYTDLTQEHLVQLLAAAAGVAAAGVAASASSSAESTQRFLKAALYESGDIAVFVDGVDEICPSYKDKLVRLLEMLLETKVKLVWVSSRPEVELDLTKALHCGTCVLRPFSEEEQKNHLRGHWSSVDPRNRPPAAFESLAAEMVAALHGAAGRGARSLLDVPPARRRCAAEA